MQYDLFLTGPLEPGVLSAVLHEVLQVPAAAVDIAAEGLNERDWTAPVLATYSEMHGDLTFSLSITSDDQRAARLSEPVLTGRLAERLNQPILCPASQPPSAYWLADGRGRPARARLYQASDLDPDIDDDLAYTIATVDRHVPALPNVPVAPIPEVILEHRLPTPLAASFTAQADAEIGTPTWHAGDALGAWESFVTRLTTGWPPDGWYPADYYAEDLRSRDDADRYTQALTPELADVMASALGTLDETYERSTIVDGGASLAEALGVPQQDVRSRGPRWQRRPANPPWTKS